MEIGKLALIDGYNSYFNCSKLTDARGSNRYSGTAIYTKIIPNKLEYTVQVMMTRKEELLLRIMNILHL